MLHRASRDVDARGRIIATLDDYAAVRDLVLGVISEGLNATVSAATRETVGAVADIVGNGSQYASNAMLEQVLKIDRSAVYRRVSKAISQGYLVNDEDRPRKPTKLKLGEALPEDEAILPERDCVAGLCTCALHSEPPKTPTDIDDATPEQEELAERLLSEHNG